MRLSLFAAIGGIVGYLVYVILYGTLQNIAILVGLMTEFVIILFGLWITRSRP